jgi:DNA polymerase III subunit gamma/tau
MSYEVLARKFRPQSFHDLIGQEHISLALLRSVNFNRIHHALLFTGPRGTGKTSSARILSKMLRCPNKSEDGNPCHQCSDCLSIAQGHHVDVIEIDGASNNGVDAIRQIRDHVQYTASSGQYKIYIIDEVHMLSTAAFNALLKTLEEPPSHVIFILATTEVQKLPLTILSRCQRYSFKRLSTKSIADHLGSICLQEGISVDKESLWLIAKAGDGSMRDAQSTLDQVLTFLGTQFTYEEVVTCLGLSHHLLVWDTFWAILERSPQKIVEILKTLSSSSFEPKIFFEQLLTLLRHTLLIQVDPVQSHNLIELADSEFKLLEQASKTYSQGELHLVFDMAHKGLSDIVTSQESKLVFDVVLLRLASAPCFKSLSDFLNTGASAKPSSEVTTRSNLTPRVTAYPNSGSGSGSGSSHPSNPGSNPRGVLSKSTEGTGPSSPKGSFHPEQWLHFIEKIRSQDPIFAAKLEPLSVRSLTEDSLDLVIPRSHRFLKEQLHNPEMMEKLKKWLLQLWKTSFNVSISEAKGQEELVTQSFSALELAQKQKNQAQGELIEQILSDPKAISARSIFKGSMTLLKPSNRKGD